MTSQDDKATDGRQARWAKHNAERRLRIIEAALEVIEEHEPGAELHVQQIATRAGLSRTVIYRHFEDREDLDRAIQQRIIDDLWSRLSPSVTLEGAVPQIIERIVGTYVSWAVEHPALHRMADYDSEPDGPLERALEEIGAKVAELVGLAVLVLGAEPTMEEVEALDPLVYGLIGAVFGAVRRWISRPTPTLTAQRLVELTSQSVWFVIDGHARTLGITLDPTRPIEALIGDSLGVSLGLSLGE